MSGEGRPAGAEHRPLLTWRSAAGIATIPFLILVVTHWPLLPLVEAGDYAQYLLHAQALLDGRPYTDTGYIFDRYAPNVGPRAYPPGLPLTLVPALAIFGRDWAVLKLLMVGSAIAFLVVATRELTLRGNAWLAIGATAMAGVALESAYATNSILSDLGFAALVWATVAAADGPGRWSWSRTALVTGLGLTAMSYRVAGIALLPAMLVVAIIARRRAGVQPFVVVAVWAVAVVAAMAATDLASQFGQTVLSAPERLPLRLSINVPIAVAALSEGLLYPLPGDRPNDVYHVVAAALSVAGGIELVRRHVRTALFWFAVFYVSLLLVAPVASPRYWWLLHPLIAFLLLTGVTMVLRLLARRSSATAGAVAGVCGLVLAACAGAATAHRPSPPTFLGTRDVQSLFAALRVEHAARPMRAYFMNPRVLTWETGIPAMALIRGPGTRVLAELQRHRISSVIVGDLGIARQARDTLVATIARQAAAFEPTYSNGSFTVYRFRPERLTAADGEVSSPASDDGTKASKPAAGS